MSKLWTPNTEPDKLLDFVKLHEDWIIDAYTEPPKDPMDNSVKPLLIVNCKGRLIPFDKIKELVSIADSLERYRVDINLNWNNYKHV